MATYSDWLLVSDIDGTLNNKKRKLPSNNKKAITNFVNAGGHFTLCSGRNLKSLEKHYLNLGISTPAIYMNGAGIYDFKTKSHIYFKPITHHGESIIFDVLKKHKTAQLTVFDATTVYRYKHTCLYGLVVSLLDNIDRKLCKTREELPTGRWGKATIFASKRVCMDIERLLKDEVNSKYVDCFYTSPYSIEIVCAGVNKGSAVKYLAEYLSIDSGKVAAIGDYFNDEAMLRSVAHPVCCGQAPEEIKALCEYITCHCNDGAVNDFINYINKTYL